MTASPPPKLPIRDCVGAALRFAVENWRLVIIVAGAGAVASTLFALLGASTLLTAVIGTFATGLVRAFAYAALLGAALIGADAIRARWPRDGVRVWSAMVVVGFFLFILFFVLSIPIMIALFAGPLAPYVGDLERAGSDQVQMMGVMARFADENPGAVLTVTLFCGAVWLLVTSRLYVAAPATLEQGRVLTFETWAWTRGAMLRIAASRLVLLLPAYVLVGALGMVTGRVLGLQASVMGGVSLEGAPPAAAIGYVLISGFLAFAIVLPLEAGLSSAIYRALKPAQPTNAA